MAKPFEARIAKTKVDVSKYLVCSKPNIWVFDDLLSERFLDHVDNMFDHGETDFFNQPEGGKSRRSRCAQVEVDEVTVELVDAIRMLAGIRQVEECRTFMIADVWGQDQDPHIDHISLKDLANRYNELNFLDLNKQSSSIGLCTRIVPTFSIVVYFNDAGGIHFPLSPMQEMIPGKRGRIVMFQNYHDSQRPVNNQLCKHYGTYFEDVPRRLMTMGILANETPSMDNSGLLTDGLIYCAGVRDEGIRHDWETLHDFGCGGTGPEFTRIPPPPPPKPKSDKVLTLDAVPDGEEWVVGVMSMAGHEVCSVRAQRTHKIGSLRKQIKDAVDPKDEFKLHLSLLGGNMVVNSKDDTSIQHLFMQDEAMALALALEPDVRTLIWQMFVKWDKDCSGEMSQDELADMLKHMDPSLKDDEISRIFVMLDSNKDNKLQWSEFLAVLGIIQDPTSAKPEPPEEQSSIRDGPV